MKTLAVIGPSGSRKAEATLGLSSQWTKGGDRLLLVDLDPLGRLTGLLRQEVSSPFSSADVLLGRAGLPDAVQTVRPGFDFLRAGPLLAALHPFAPHVSRVGDRWAKALQQVEADYDRCLVLVSEESGRVLSSAAVAAAQGALALVEPASFGLKEIEETMRKIHRAARGVPKAVWISLLGFRARSPLSQNFLMGLRSRFGEHLLQTVVSDPPDSPQTTLQALAAELRHRMGRDQAGLGGLELARSSGP